MHALKFAAHVAKAEFARHKLDPAMLTSAILGMMVPQSTSFTDMPWAME